MKTASGILSGFMISSALLLSAPSVAQMQAVEGIGFDGGPARQLAEVYPAVEDPGIALREAMIEYGIDLEPEMIDAVVRERLDSPGQFPEGRPTEISEWLWSLVNSPETGDTPGLGLVFWRIRDTSNGPLLIATGASLEPRFGYEVIIAPPGAIPTGDKTAFFVGVEFIRPIDDERTIEHAVLMLSDENLLRPRVIDLFSYPLSENSVWFETVPELILDPVDGIRASESLMVVFYLDDGSYYLAAIRLGEFGGAVVEDAFTQWNRSK